MVIGCRESDGSAVVLTVKAGGAAKSLGVRPGMVVSRVNGKPMSNYDSVMAIVPNLPRPMKLIFDEKSFTKVKPPHPPPAQQKKSSSSLTGTNAGTKNKPVVVSPSPVAKTIISTKEIGREEKVVAKGAVASRWEQMRAEHDEASNRKLMDAKESRQAEIDSHTAASDVTERVRYFNELFQTAIREAIAEAKVLAQRDASIAAAERQRRRELLQAQWENDLAARRAPRPRFENISGSPDQLVIALKSPAVRPENDDPRQSKTAAKLHKIRELRNDQLFYALVDVAHLEKGATAQKWIKYEKPIQIDQPGRYALVAKMVPGKKKPESEFSPIEDKKEIKIPHKVLGEATHTGYDSDADSVLYENCAFESQVSAAVFDLGPSPPLMQYEECQRELAFIPLQNAGNRKCRKCQCPASATRKLYARGDYCICRTCALKGAGVLIDPGARRMWFSQMISFVGNRAIPLQRSQPLLTQILRVMQSHPGLAVRFEGHVNSRCLLSCDGKMPCPSTMCKTAPGGAFGLSTARADAVRAFVIACGIEPDRVYAQGFAGTRRLTDNLDEQHGYINRRVECHTLLC